MKWYVHDLEDTPTQKKKKKHLYFFKIEMRKMFYSLRLKESLIFVFELVTKEEYTKESPQRIFRVWGIRECPLQYLL
jgi:hypothetical protein